MHDSSAAGHPSLEQRDGVISGIGAYMLWGLFPLFFHHLRPASALEVLGHRIVWSFVVVTIVLIVKRRPSGLAVLAADPRRAVRIATAALLLATNWLVYVWAVNSRHVVDAALGYFINPLVSVGLGVVVLHEHLRAAQRRAVMLGAASVVVLTMGYGRVPWIAIVLAVTFAAYGYLKKTTGLDDAVGSLAAESAVLLPLAGIGLVVAETVGHGVTFTSHGSGHVVLLLLTGPITAVPLVLFGVAARRIPLSLVGLLQFLTPIGQFLCGVLVFHEAVPPARIAGFALVWGALVLLATDAWREYRRPSLAAGAASTA